MSEDSVVTVPGAHKAGVVTFVVMIARLEKAHPAVPIVTAAIDENLSEHGQITPGLGDAVGRMFGRTQSSMEPSPRAPPAAGRREPTAYRGSEARGGAMDGREDESFGRTIARQAAPAFLLNAPFSLDTAIANNATMEKLGPAGRAVDRGRALAQWLRLYHHMAARGLVYLLPSVAGLQDQPFVANLGAMLVHLDDPLFLLSRFRARGRAGEVPVGAAFFEMMGIPTATAPAEFEGEADLKYLRDGIYFGGYGLRSSVAAHRFMAERFGMTVVPLALDDPHLYHLDCILHVVDPTTVLLATGAVEREQLRAVEAVAGVIDVPVELAYRGATNVARMGTSLLCDLRVGEGPWREVETAKRAFWERTCAALGLEPVWFELSEFHKSGGMLSCLVLPLNAPHLRAQPG